MYVKIIYDYMYICHDSVDMHLKFMYMSCVVHCKLNHPSFQWYSNKIILTHSSSTCFAEHTEHLLLLIKSHPKRPKTWRHILHFQCSPQISPLPLGFPISICFKMGAPRNHGEFTMPSIHFIEAMEESCPSKFSLHQLHPIKSYNNSHYPLVN